MPGSLNIRASTDDPHYRYKMPALESRTTTKGQYGHTTLLNVVDVAAALHRDAEELLRFMAYELGVPNPGKPTPGHSVILKGLHRTSDLQAVVYSYADKFVLCPNCHDPETIYVVDPNPRARDKGAIRHFCRACHADAARQELVDPSHKLCNFIINRERAAQQSVKKKAASGGAGGGDGSDSSDGGKRKDKMEKKKKNKKKKEKGRSKHADAEPTKGQGSANGGGGGGGGGGHAAERLVHGGYSFDASDPLAWAADFSAQGYSDEDAAAFASSLPPPDDNASCAANEAASSSSMMSPEALPTDDAEQQQQQQQPVAASVLLDLARVAAAARLLEVALDGGALVPTAAALLQPPRGAAARGKTMSLTPTEACAAVFRAAFGRCGLSAAAAAAAYTRNFRPVFNAVVAPAAAAAVVTAATTTAAAATAATAAEGCLLASVELHFAGVDLAGSSSGGDVDGAAPRRPSPLLALLPLLLHLCHQDDLLSAATLQSWLAEPAAAATATGSGADPLLLAVAKAKAKAFVDGLVNEDDSESDSDDSDSNDDE
jgi:translation initiation factor 2 beta subunit (eIF-2beta)/eIF-5